MQTYVDLYEIKKIRASEAELDCEGMILLVMMSSGDYAPAGIPRCGIKTACEVATVGFGKELCTSVKKNMTSLTE